MLEYLLLTTCVFTLTGFLGRILWLFDLTSHFRLQYALIQFISMGFLYYSHQTEWLIATVGCCMLINVSQLLPFYLKNPFRTHPTRTEPLRLFHLNVWVKNHHYERTAKLIETLNPDILTIQEYFPHWREGLAKTGITEQYPYQLDDGTELGILSRIPITRHRIIHASPHTSPAEDPTMIVELNHPNGSITLAMTHTYTPIEPHTYARQKRHLAQVTELCQTIPSPFILVGDMNTTPWSHPFRQLLKRTRLKNTMLGQGLYPTWPTYLLPFMLPIDHILVSPDITIQTRQVGPSTGSDHLPVYIELGLPTPTSQT